MLVLKKISIKKLAVYLAIIFFMLSGAGFMLYQNKKLSSGRPAGANLPPVPAVALEGNTPGMTGVNNPPPAEPSQVLDTKVLDINLPARPAPAGKNNQNRGFDLNIFSSDKFKNLQENIIIKKPSAAGKRDPFKPN
ncbi:MAG: hypothetical protein HYV53_03700 [Parcubacteria group bacterium]|nr:hypothetical protein [Parcubacteria group bacterium]